MKIRLTTSLCILFSTLSLSAEIIASYQEQLITIGKLDQKIRTEYTYWDDRVRIDKENLATLKKLIDKYGFPTINKVGQEANNYAFLIAQHAASDQAFMLYYLNELKKREKTQEINKKHIAYLVDRTNLLSDKKQIYGTQGKCSDGMWQPHLLKEPLQLNERRKSLGLMSVERFSRMICKK